MQTLRLTTLIDAPVQRCFLLSLSADLHLRSPGQTNEQCTGPVTSTLSSPGSGVKWFTRLLGLHLEHTSVIELSRPYTYFRSVMRVGNRVLYEHEHHFAPMNDGTRMRVEIRFAPPPGILGPLLQGKLRDHLRSFLIDRNERICQIAESETWHLYLDGLPGVEDPSLPDHAETLNV